MTHYEPGTTFLARVDRWPLATEWPDDTSMVRLRVEPDGSIYAHDSDPAAPLAIPPQCRRHIHPLVVLDLDNQEIVGGSITAADDLLTAAAYDRGEPSPAERHTLIVVAEQIAKQTRPPKPPEPTGLGAVVKDRDGQRWLRLCSRETVGMVWGKPGTSIASLRYDDIDAVEVLSEGVPNG